MRTARIEVYRTTLESCTTRRCTLDRRPCGIISQSSEGYRRLRDLVRGLELSHPGYRACQFRSAWYLCPPRLMPETPLIPISVPEGVSLNSRRSR